MAPRVKLKAVEIFMLRSIVKETLEHISLFSPVKHLCDLCFEVIAQSVESASFCTEVSDSITALAASLPIGHT